MEERRQLFLNPGSLSKALRVHCGHEIRPLNCTAETRLTLRADRVHGMCEQMSDHHGRLLFYEFFVRMFPSSKTQTSSKPSDCLILYRLPARLDAAQTAALLGFQPHDIPVLISAGLLKPLGRPAPNSIKYFAAIGIERLREDGDWLDKATRVIGRHWQERNRTGQTSQKSSQQKE